MGILIVKRVLYLFFSLVTLYLPKLKGWKCQFHLREKEKVQQKQLLVSYIQLNPGIKFILKIMKKSEYIKEILKLEDTGKNGTYNSL